MKSLLTAVLGGCLLVSTVAPSGAEPPYATGPYADEEAYFSEVFAKTTGIEYKKTVGVIDAVALVVINQVKDRCWSNTEAVTARLRAELERSDIAVYEEPLAPSPFSPVLNITVLGYKAGDICIATIRAEVGFGYPARIGSLARTDGVYHIEGVQNMWHQTSILSEYDNLNEKIMSTAQEMTDMLVADILAARRDPNVQKMLSSWTNRKPITVREVEAAVQQLMKKAKK